jgi:hypothetical protein
MQGKPKPYIRNRARWPELEKLVEGYEVLSDTLTINWLGHVARAVNNKKTHRWKLYIDDKHVEISKVNDKFVWDVAGIAVDRIREKEAIK